MFPTSLSQWTRWTHEVGRVGEGEAASLAALNAIACLRKGVCMQPLPDAWLFWPGL